MECVCVCVCGKFTYNIQINMEIGEDMAEVSMCNIPRINSG
jgi:hypothetical protein